jgi:hypothetical protein
MPPIEPSEQRKSNGHGGKRKGSGRPRSTPVPGPAVKTRVLGQTFRQTHRSQIARGLESSTEIYSPFFGPYHSHQPIPLGNSVTPVQNGRPSMWSTVGMSGREAASQLMPNSRPDNSCMLIFFSTTIQSDLHK